MRRYSLGTSDSRHQPRPTVVEDSSLATASSLCASPLRSGSLNITPDSVNIDTQHQHSPVADFPPCPEEGHSPSSSKPATSEVPNSYHELRCLPDTEDSSSTKSFHSTVSYLEAAAVDDPVERNEKNWPQEAEQRAEQASARPSWISVGLIHLHPMLRESLAIQLGDNGLDIDSQRTPIAAPATSSVVEGIDRSVPVGGAHMKNLTLTRQNAGAFLRRVLDRRVQQSRRSTTAFEPNTQKCWDGLQRLDEDKRSFSSTSNLVYGGGQEVVANMKHKGPSLDSLNWLAEMDRDGPIPEEYRPIPSALDLW